MSELHGVDRVSAGGGVRVITTINTAVIGLIGTAPDAEPGQSASVVTGSALLDNQMIFTAAPGGACNSYTVSITAGEPDAKEARFDWTAPDLVITLPVDKDGAFFMTAAEVVGGFNVQQRPELKAALVAGSQGGGVVTAQGKTAFAGGRDEPFPLNRPALVTGSDTQAGRLGDAGTLRVALQEIFAQTGALVVVVRVPVETDENGVEDAELTRAGVVTGMSAFMQAQQKNNQQPRVFIAPDFSEDDSVGKALEVVATRMRGVAYLDSPSAATPVEVVQRRSIYGERVEILRPRVLGTGRDGMAVMRPYSAFAAGLRARTDEEDGYWYSKSNHPVNGFSDLEQYDDWAMGDENSTANLLNMNNVSTVINFGGFKHWGNRNCSSDPLRWFEVAVRTDDILWASIQVGLFNYVDRPLDRMLAEDAVAMTNAYLREQTQLGAIHGGKAWLDPELNTEATLLAGHLFVDYDYGFKSPAERITGRVHVNPQYAKEALGV